MIIFKKLLNILSIALLVFSVIAFPQETVAMENPNAIAIDTLEVFQDIYETGDMVFLEQHHITYNVTQNTSIADNFIMALYDTDGATLMTSRALVAFTNNDSGYEYAFNALYFDSTQTANITWGGNYTIRIMGNPAVFPEIIEGVNKASLLLGVNNWIDFTDTVTNYSLFNSYCLYGNGEGIAKTLQDNGWGQLIAHTISGDVLNETGRNYFLEVLPGLDTVNSGLFQSSQSSIIVDYTTHNQSLQTEYTMNGTLGSQIRASFDGVAVMLGIQAGVVYAGWAGFLVLMIAAIVFLYTGNSTIGIIVAIPAMFIGLYVGAIPMWLFFAIVFLVVLYTVYHIVLR